MVWCRRCTLHGAQGAQRAKGILLKWGHEATLQRSGPLLWGHLFRVMSPSPKKKPLPLSLGKKRTCGAAPLSASRSAPLLTFTPMGFTFPPAGGKASELLRAGSRADPGPTHRDFPAFLRQEGAGRSRGAAARAARPSAGFYCRRCIPREGGRLCVCAGAFPHSARLLFNGGLHAGQAPQEVRRCPAP